MLASVLAPNEKATQEAVIAKLSPSRDLVGALAVATSLILAELNELGEPEDVDRESTWEQAMKRFEELLQREAAFALVLGYTHETFDWEDFTSDTPKKIKPTGVSIDLQLDANESNKKLN